MTDEQKNRGVAIFSTIFAVTLTRLNLARLIAKQFDMPFWQAYRWTSLVAWSVYFAARSWSGGILSQEKYLNLVEKWGEDLKEQAAKKKAQSNV